MTQVLFSCPDKVAGVHETITGQTGLENAPDGFYWIEVRSTLGKPKQMNRRVLFGPLLYRLGFMGPVVIQDNKYRACLYLST